MSKSQTMCCKRPLTGLVLRTEQIAVRYEKTNLVFCPTLLETMPLMPSTTTIKSLSTKELLATSILLLLLLLLILVSYIFPNYIYKKKIDSLIICDIFRERPLANILSNGYSKLININFLPIINIYF